MEREVATYTPGATSWNVKPPSARVNVAYCPPLSVSGVVASRDRSGSESRPSIGYVNSSWSASSFGRARARARARGERGRGEKRAA